MASSGIRVGTIKSLKVKSLKRLDNGIGLIAVYPESKESSYTTLITSECLSSIDSYLKFRKEQGEKIIEDSWLIRDKFATFSYRTNKPKASSEYAINKQMRSLLKIRSSLRTTATRSCFEKILQYCFNKFRCCIYI